MVRIPTLIGSLKCDPPKGNGRRPKKKAIGCLWLTTHCLCGKLACVSVGREKGRRDYSNLFEGSHACRTPCVHFSLVVWPDSNERCCCQLSSKVNYSTDPVSDHYQLGDAATKLLDKACQKLKISHSRGSLTSKLPYANSYWIVVQSLPAKE